MSARESDEVSDARRSGIGIGVRIERRRLGLCISCGGKRDHAAQDCWACIAYQRKKRNEAVANGLCAMCFSPRGESLSGCYCVSCREYRNKAARSRMHTKRQAGYCGYAGCYQKQDLGKRFCCQHDEQMTAYIRSPQKREADRAYRQQANKRGVCTSCGGGPLVTQVRCDVCRKKHNEYVRNWNAQKKVAE